MRDLWLCGVPILHPHHALTACVFQIALRVNLLLKDRVACYVADACDQAKTSKCVQDLMMKTGEYSDKMCEYIEANIACYESNGCCNDNAKRGLEAIAAQDKVKDCPKKTCSADSSPASILRAGAFSAVLAAAAIAFVAIR